MSINKWVGIGRLTKDVETRYSQGEKPMAISRYTLAVDRRFKVEGQPSADFVGCIAFGNAGEFAEKYFKKGMKVAVVGRIQTGSYEKDGHKVYTTDVVVEEQNFAESKKDDTEGTPSSVGDGFMSIPEGLEDELPFN